MWKYIKDFGMLLRSISGYVWLLTTILPTVATFVLGIYECLSWAESVTLTTVTIAAGVDLCVGGLWLYDLFFAGKPRVPLIDIFKKAEQFGWRICQPDSLEVLDLCKALRQAGVDKELIFYGTSEESKILELIRNAPLQEINSEHWLTHNIPLDFLVYHHYGSDASYNDDNVSTRSQRNGDNAVGFHDLHVSGVNNRWLQQAAKKYQGKTAEDAKKRDNQWKPVFTN